MIGWAMVLRCGEGIRSFKARGFKKKARSDLMKNPNLQKNADYPLGIWTKISKFSNFKSDFFPLKDMTSQKPKWGHIYIT